ncbi:winged helix DNA-binding protein [Sphingobium sp. DEHP117]|uniref:winged helix DNA-binding protein n=1 Tax=Sphingobium sp. DEHP117 TaxID=2993436 RepID=UPI0027D7496D|nr:winged helix DNA-binding protein [Sphingobium sp. DEHP117]MDQ4421021.1 winged helix DNA-binding protein [Sphingobium sp. DEHP117]
MPIEPAEHQWTTPPHYPMEGFGFAKADHQTSVLICTGDSMAGEAGQAMGRVAALARATGLRILDTVSISSAAEQLRNMVAPDAFILCCTGEEAGVGELLVQLGRQAEAGHLAAIVITKLAGLDIVHGHLGSDRPILLCDPSGEDLIAAVAALVQHQAAGNYLHDVGAETEAEVDHFQRLNDQLLRLNRMVEALVQDRAPEEADLRPWGEAGEMALKSPKRVYRGGPFEAPGWQEPISAQQVRAILRVRRLRDHLVAPDLFADPAWDILLDLLAARLENTKVSVSSLCIAAAVPPTTALRWIRQLTDRRLLERQADPSDGRRIFITLSDAGMHAVVRWFHETRALLLTALGEGEDDGFRKGV